MTRFYPLLLLTAFGCEPRVPSLTCYWQLAEVVPSDPEQCFLMEAIPGSTGILVDPEPGCADEPEACVVLHPGETAYIYSKATFLGETSGEGMVLPCEVIAGSTPQGCYNSQD